MTRNSRRWNLFGFWLEERTTLLPDEWNDLDQIRRRLVIIYLRWLYIDHMIKGVPGFVRLSFIHGLATLFTICLFPPPPHTPAIAVPVVWGASWGTAITIYTLTPLLKHLS